MKNKIAVLLGASVLASNVSVYAGDKEWAVVGKVLTGIAAVQVIDRIVNPPQTVVYVQQPTVVQTVPVVTTTQTVIVQSQPVVYVQPTPVVYYSSPNVTIYPGCSTPVYHHYHHQRRHCR